MSEPTPAEIHADAKNRSVRTLAQGLAIDLLVAVGATIVAVVATWDGDDILALSSWVVLGAAVGKSVLTAGASYLARLKLPPKEDTP
jgi:hypothetical protein